MGTINYINLPNRHLKNKIADELFHLGISLNDQVLVEKFDKVKFVLVGGTRERMETLARHLATSILGRAEDDFSFDHSFQNSRYSGYLVGPIFCVNHGIGNPSLSVALHEIFKLLYRARCSDVTLIRIGTCGGIGVDVGTVVVTSEALTVGFEPYYNTSSLGQPLRLPTSAHVDLVEDLLQCRGDNSTFLVVKGKTYCADDFYQAQGRLDGSFCDFDEKGKEEFMNKLQKLGVVNIEMESAGVLGLANRVGVKAAVVCVVIVDRMTTDLPQLNKQEFQQIEDHPMQLITAYLQRHIH
ncbi:uridine phosphorylase 1 [Biomphalaria glabrata]|nr:uridine phosphorylase 1-like [Biomphalaria glabrata]